MNCVHNCDDHSSVTLFQIRISTYEIFHISLHSCSPVGLLPLAEPTHAHFVHSINVPEPLSLASEVSLSQLPKWTTWTLLDLTMPSLELKQVDSINKVSWGFDVTNYKHAMS